MTWAEGVEEVLDKVSTLAEGDDLDKVIANVALEVTRKIMDTMSLARIATGSDISCISKRFNRRIKHTLKKDITAIT